MLYSLILPLSSSDKKKLKIAAGRDAASANPFENFNKDSGATVLYERGVERIDSVTGKRSGYYFSTLDLNFSEDIKENLASDCKTLIKNVLDSPLSDWKLFSVDNQEIDFGVVFSQYKQGEGGDKAVICAEWLIEAVSRKYVSQQIIKDLYIEDYNFEQSKDEFAKTVQTKCLEHILKRPVFKTQGHKVNEWINAAPWLMEKSDLGTARGIANRDFVQELGMSSSIFNRLNPRDIQNAMKAGFACVLSQFGFPLLPLTKKTYLKSVYSEDLYPRPWHIVADRFKMPGNMKKMADLRPFEKVWSLLNDSILSVMTPAGLMVSIRGNSSTDGDLNDFMRNGGTKYLGDLAKGKFPSYKQTMPDTTKKPLNLKFVDKIEKEVDSGCFAYFTGLLIQYAEEKNIKNLIGLSLPVSKYNIRTYPHNTRDYSENNIRAVENRLLADIASMMAESLNMFVVRDSFSIMRANSRFTNVNKINEWAGQAKWSPLNIFGFNMPQLFKDANPICPIFTVVWVLHTPNDDIPRGQRTKSRNYKLQNAVKKLCDEINKSGDWQTCENFNPTAQLQAQTDIPGPDVTADSGVVEDYSRWEYRDLQQEAMKLKLRANGKREELIERLQSAAQPQAETVVPEPRAPDPTPGVPGDSVGELFEKRYRGYLSHIGKDDPTSEEKIETKKLFCNVRGLHILGERRYNAIQKMRAYYEDCEDYYNKEIKGINEFKFDKEPFKIGITKKEAFVVSRTGESNIQVGILVQQKIAKWDVATWERDEQETALDKLRKLANRFCKSSDGDALHFMYMTPLTDDVASMCRDGFACIKAGLKRDVMVNCYEGWSVLAGLAPYILDTFLNMYVAVGDKTAKMMSYLLKYNQAWRPAVEVAFLGIASQAAIEAYNSGGSLLVALGSNLIATLYNPVVLGALTATSVIATGATAAYALTSTNRTVVRFSRLLEIAKENSTRGATRITMKRMVQQMFDVNFNNVQERLLSRQVFGLTVAKWERKVRAVCSKGLTYAANKMAGFFLGNSWWHGISYFLYALLHIVLSSNEGFKDYVGKYMENLYQVDAGLASALCAAAVVKITTAAIKTTEDEKEEKIREKMKEGKWKEDLQQAMDFLSEGAEDDVPPEDKNWKQLQKEFKDIGDLLPMAADFCVYIFGLNFLREGTGSVPTVVFGSFNPGEAELVTTWFNKGSFIQNWNMMEIAGKILEFAAKWGALSLLKVPDLWAILLALGGTETTASATSDIESLETGMQCGQAALLTIMRHVTNTFSDVMCTARNMTSFLAWYHLAQVDKEDAYVDSTGKNLILTVVPLWIDKCMKVLPKDFKYEGYKKRDIFSFLGNIKSEKVSEKLKECYRHLKEKNFSEAVKKYLNCDEYIFGRQKTMQATVTLLEHLKNNETKIKLACSNQSDCFVVAGKAHEAFRNSTLQLEGMTEADAKAVAAQFMGQNVTQIDKKLMESITHYDNLPGTPHNRVALTFQGALSPQLSAHCVFKDDTPDSSQRLEDLRKSSASSASSASASDSSARWTAWTSVLPSGGTVVYYLFTAYLRHRAYKLEEKWLLLAHSSYFSDMLSQGDQVKCPENEGGSLPYIWLNTKRNLSQKDQWLSHLKKEDKTREKIRQSKSKHNKEGYTFNFSLVGTDSEEFKADQSKRWLPDLSYKSDFSLENNSETGAEPGRGIVLTSDGYARVPGCKCVTDDSTA